MRVVYHTISSAEEYLFVMSEKEQPIEERLQALQEQSLEHTRASLEYMEQMGIRPEGKFGLFLPPEFRAKEVHRMPFNHSVKQKVVYETEKGEFSALCPFSGLPDYGVLTIEYVPGSYILELKSLKYYIMSWRHIGSAQEDLTAYIFNDLKKELGDAEYLRITTDYNVRGGIHTVCTIDSREQ